MMLLKTTVTTLLLLLMLMVILSSSSAANTANGAADDNDDEHRHLVIDHLQGDVEMLKSTITALAERETAHVLEICQLKQALERHEIIEKRRNHKIQQQQRRRRMKTAEDESAVRHRRTFSRSILSKANFHSIARLRNRVREICRKNNLKCPSVLFTGTGSSGSSGNYGGRFACRNRRDTVRP